MLTAKENKEKTHKIVKDNDVVYNKHLKIFENKINEAVLKGELSVYICIIKPSELAISELKLLGYIVEKIPPKPQNSMVRELMEKNRGNWETTIKIKWE
tara:strand:- start:1777 stop:2073 length:297 start_codon:yes stop_codon:yes gene_type:complete